MVTSADRPKSSTRCAKAADERSVTKPLATRFDTRLLSADNSLLICSSSRRRAAASLRIDS